MESETLQWLNGLSNTTEISRITRETLGVDLHPSALSHLAEAGSKGEAAFPRLEAHIGYLFGTFYVPSNADNPAADFDRITFVATHDAVVAAVGVHPTSNRDWSATRQELFAIDRSDSTPDGGQFILNFLQLATDELLADAITVRDYLRSAFQSLTGVVDMTKNVSELVHEKSLTNRDRRLALSEVRKLLPTANGIAAELPTMVRIAHETAEILSSLVNNDHDRDLQTDLGGQDRELFSRHLEIYLADYLIEAKQLLATLNQVESLLSSLFDRARQLSEEEEVAAGRFTGAIASIMLLPTFIVGLYGQNFVDMPETDWQYGYFFSWGSIVLVTIVQILFFRKRRWI